ncbi:MAG TPA: methyltransferase domain-containing protein [Bradyrhizobium sp.]|nr:methyltransferase domain-containing protein [Bradyrhizobium sp.]
MRTATRIDYDAIAHVYDAQPYRGKAVDPALLSFLEQRTERSPPSILNIACGTGSQLVENRSIVAGAHLVGLDRSLGMLRQARPKATGIAWVQSDAVLLPFRPKSFDFISCQFAFHHVPDKAAMLREVFRVLRRDGRFVMRNLCPHEHPDWLYYDYFPEARTIDFMDFWPLERIVTTMEASGFAVIVVEPEHLRFEQDLCAWLDMVRQRHLNSQLMAISDSSYAAGISRLERDVNDESWPQVRPDHLCLITIRGDKRI